MGGLVAIVVGGVALLGVLMCGALALRASVAVANRVVRPSEPTRPTFDDPLDELNWDEWEAEEPPRRPKKAIPEPGVGKGMMIASTVGVVTAFVGVVVSLVLEGALADLFDSDDGRAIALAVFALPLSFGGAAVLLAAMLPTTFPRALLVAFLYHVIGLVVAGTVGGVIVFALRV